MKKRRKSNILHILEKSLVGGLKSRHFHCPICGQYTPVAVIEKPKETICRKCEKPIKIKYISDEEYYSNKRPRVRDREYF